MFRQITACLACVSWALSGFLSSKAVLHSPREAWRESTCWLYICSPRNNFLEILESSRGLCRERGYTGWRRNHQRKLVSGRRARIEYSPTPIYQLYYCIHKSRVILVLDKMQSLWHIGWFEADESYPPSISQNPWFSIVWFLMKTVLFVSAESEVKKTTVTWFEVPVNVVEPMNIIKPTGDLSEYMQIFVFVISHRTLVPS